MPDARRHRQNTLKDLSRLILKEGWQLVNVCGGDLWYIRNPEQTYREYYSEGIAKSLIAAGGLIISPISDEDHDVWERPKKG